MSDRTPPHRRSGAARTDADRRVSGGRGALALLALVASAAACGTPDAQGPQATSPTWLMQAKQLDSAKFVVLVVSSGPHGLSVEHAASGDLLTLRPRERSRSLGEPIGEPDAHVLCARLIHSGADTSRGRCVPWRPPHAAPDRSLDAAHAATAGAVSIRLAMPVPGDVWLLSDGTGATTRWPAAGTP